MSPHLKHMLIAANLILGAVAVVWIQGVYDLRKADRMAARDEKIAANQVKVKDAQETVKTAQDSIRATDEETKAKLANLQQQIASKPDSATIRAIVEASLPGVKTVAGTDAAGNPIVGVADTQGTRDAFNRADVAFKTCQFNLSDCEAKQANYLTIIASQKKQIEADEDPKTGTIPLQAAQIKDLQKYQVPRWTAMIGVGKTQGSNFRDVNSYQPFLGLDYRLTSRIGVFGAAQNKSAAAGISWHFGSVR